MRILMAAVVMCVGVVSLSAGGKQPNPLLPNPGSTKSRIAYDQTVSSPTPTPKPGKGRAGPIQKTVPVEGQDFVFALRNDSGFGDGLIQPIVMKWIPAGTFQMGSTEATDPNRSDDETLHTVTLTQGYWLMETEVTQEMYYAVMGLGRGEAYFPDPKNPMETVRWGDAYDFCRDIGKNYILRTFNDLSGFEFRLPTEAEWEYACRAGTTTAVYVNYGDRNKELDAIAWWDWNSGNATRNVRQKRPNAWGMYDMIGNVWEWCSDRYDAYPTGSVTDPTGPSTGSGRVCRGGGWSGDAGYVRSAARFWDVPGYRGHYLGFRPALSSVR